MSGAELEAWLPATKVLTYPQLAEYDNVWDVLGSAQRCVILYETRRGYGHWVCVFTRGRVIEVFDAYGIVPDDELAWIPDAFRRENNEDYPHLSYLLYRSGRQIHYNDHRLQRMTAGVATCGRHCVMRLAFRHLSDDAYAQMLRELGDPDAVVAEVVR